LPNGVKKVLTHSDYKNLESPTIKNGPHIVKIVWDALLVTSVSYPGSDEQWKFIWDEVSPYVKIDAKLHGEMVLNRITEKLMVSNASVGSLLLLKTIVESQNFKDDAYLVFPTEKENVLTSLAMRSAHSLWLYDLADVLALRLEAPRNDAFEEALKNVLLSIVKIMPQIEEKHWAIYLGQNASFGKTNNINNIFGSGEEVEVSLKMRNVLLEHPICRGLWSKNSKFTSIETFRTAHELRLWYLESGLSNYSAHQSESLKVFSSMLQDVREDLANSELNKGLPDNKSAWNALLKKCKAIKSADRSGASQIAAFCTDVERVFLLTNAPKLVSSVSNAQGGQNSRVRRRM